MNNRHATMSNRHLHAPVIAPPRKGVSTPVLLVTLSIALLLLMAAVDLAQLAHQRDQIQNGVDAATLASAPLLMDQRWLYLGPANSRENLSGLEQRLEDVKLLQVAAARQQAVLYAGMNDVAGKPIVITPNETNDSAGDVVVGFVREPAKRDLPMEPEAGDGSLNAVVVEASRRDAAGDLPLLWMARQAGLSRIDMKVRSQAVVDQRVYGFRPLEHVSVPLVPLVIFPDALPTDEEDNGNDDGGGDDGDNDGDDDDRSDDEEIVVADEQRSPEADLPDHLWWAQGPLDAFIVDSRTSTVEPAAYGQQGDGIAEMVIRIASARSGEPKIKLTTQIGAVVGFGLEQINAQRFNNLSLAGLTRADLQLLDGQLAPLDGAPPRLPVKFRLPSEELNEMCSLLSSEDVPLLGHRRIFPLGGNVVETEAGFAVDIVGYVAGRIVHCRRSTKDDSLIIIIQPCLLQTPTALTGEVVRRNAWIGKLLLNR